MHTNVAIMCMGSQGDCQPFIALALALQAKGARVRLYAPAEMEELCATFVAPLARPLIDFFGMPHLSVKKLLESDPVVRDAMSRGNFFKFMQGFSQPNYLDMTLSDADLVLSDLLSITSPQTTLCTIPFLQRKVRRPRRCSMSRPHW